MRTAAVAAVAAAALAVLTLAGCATQPPKVAAACPEDAEFFAIKAALQKLYPDPKQHHLLVRDRTTDADGNQVLDIDVWPMSGPQEPAPPHKVRLVFTPCTFKPVALAKVG